MKFYFEKLCKEDLDLILSWRNSDEVRQNMKNNKIISRDEHYQWFDKICLADNIEYFVFKKNEEPIGIINFVDIDLLSKECSWGFYLGAKESLIGAGSVMEFWALDYVFYNLKLEKLNSEIFEFNLGNLQLQKSFGFKEEGSLEFLRDNQLLKLFKFVMFNREWKDKRIRIFSMLPKAYQSALNENLVERIIVS